MVSLLACWHPGFAAPKEMENLGPHSVAQRYVWLPRDCPNPTGTPSVALFKIVWTQILLNICAAMCKMLVMVSSIF